MAAVYRCPERRSSAVARLRSATRSASACWPSALSVRASSVLCGSTPVPMRVAASSVATARRAQSTARAGSPLASATRAAAPSTCPREYADFSPARTRLASPSRRAARSTSPPAQRRADGERQHADQSRPRAGRTSLLQRLVEGRRRLGVAARREERDRVGRQHRERGAVFGIGRARDAHRACGDVDGLQHLAGLEEHRAPVVQVDRHAPRVAQALALEHAVEPPVRRVRRRVVERLGQGRGERRDGIDLARRARRAGPLPGRPRARAATTARGASPAMRAAMLSNTRQPDSYSA